MKSYLSCILLCISTQVSVSVFAQSQPTHIELFAHSPGGAYTVLPSATLTIYDLDQRTELEKVSPRFEYDGTKSSEIRAAKQAKEWLSTTEGRRFMERQKDLVKPVQLMAVYGIEKTPAIVFDRQYVVYGTLDIKLALQDFDAYQEQQKEVE